MPFAATFSRPSPLITTKWIDITAILLGIFFAAFILHSYPMMYPGYDIWWHLGVMKTGAAYDPSMAEYARWHRAWDKVLNAIEIEDIFTRALIIHRTQFLISAACIGYSAYLCLISIFRIEDHKKLCRLASLLAIAIWLSMHGTHSSAHFGGPESEITQSWIAWYSVNYQISLPFYFLATGGTLAIASSAQSNNAARRTAVIVILALGALIYCHLAELPYYLYSVLAMGLIFGSKRQKLSFICLLAAALALLATFLPLISHRVPELPGLLFSGSYSKIFELVSERGASLVELGENRSETSWNPIYTCSFISLIACAFFEKFLSKNRQISIRPIVFLMATALLPLALFNTYSSGLLALITNQDLAWRFSFSSLLFVGIPTLLVFSAIKLGQSSKTRAPIFFAPIFCILLSIAYISINSSVVRANVKSIWNSQFPEKVYFGISPNNRLAVERAARSLSAEASGASRCFDIFSTYYLFYLYTDRHICLPSSIASLPGAREAAITSPDCQCSFERDVGEYTSRGITPPEWKFNFAEPSKGNQ